MCGQIATRGQIAEITRDLRMTWVLIQEAALRESSDELADIAVSLFGQLGEAQAEISRLRVARYVPASRQAPDYQQAPDCEQPLALANR